MKHAIGTACRDTDAIILDRANVWILPGAPGILHYCKKDKANYIVIQKVEEKHPPTPPTPGGQLGFVRPFRGCANPVQSSSPLKNFHLPSTERTLGVGS